MNVTPAGIACWRHQIDYTDQVQQQRLVGVIFSSLFIRLPVDERDHLPPRRLDEGG